jgi:hypothetical protein
VLSSSLIFQNCKHHQWILNYHHKHLFTGDFSKISFASQLWQDVLQIYDLN